MKTFDDFDDEEFPPLGQTAQVSPKPVSKTPSKRRVQRGKLRMPSMKKNVKPMRGTPARPSETGSIGRKTESAPTLTEENAADCVTEQKAVGNEEEEIPLQQNVEFGVLEPQGQGLLHEIGTAKEFCRQKF